MLRKIITCQEAIFSFVSVFLLPISHLFYYNKRYERAKNTSVISKTLPIFHQRNV
jgi:hypothetical protein